jgi:hypothetical protein
LPRPDAIAFWNALKPLDTFFICQYIKRLAQPWTDAGGNGHRHEARCGLPCGKDRVTEVELGLKGIVIIAGNYGSGKTEVAVNLAVDQRRRGVQVRMADLDLVNPYFRTREVRHLLAAMDIDVVLPPEQYLKADLPILDPGVAGLIRQPAELTLLDVGGNGVGATVLAALAEAFNHQPCQMLQVVNPFRPNTDSMSGCRKIRDEIESAAKIVMTGIIGNANLIDDTRVEDIYRGYQFVCDLADHSGLPLAFITAAKELLPDLDPTRFACPILTIARQLVPPWKKATAI